MIRMHATEDAFATYVDEARTRATADLRKLTQSLSSAFGRVPMIQRRGKPEDVILEFVASEGIDILVMGTVARGGIPGLLIRQYRGAGAQKAALFGPHAEAR